jgi:hypothetical protein
VSGPVIVAGVRPLPKHSDELVPALQRQVAERDAALQVLRMAASRAVGYMQGATEWQPAEAKQLHAEVLDGLREAIKSSGVWPFPSPMPAVRDELARQHQAQQRDAIVNGPEALL